MDFKLLAFILYFVVILGIGIFFFFKSRGGGEKDYFLGGRSMGPWVTALSAQASDMSGWLLMGFPGSLLAFGMGKLWIGIGLAIGTAANWIFVARRLRKFSQAANDSITVPQYLSNRFLTKSPVLQIICAVVFLVFFTIYVASSFVAGAKVFGNVIPALAENPSVALLIFAAIIILYTFLGGFKAVCWTDFFQGLMMLVALLAVPIVLLFVKNVDLSMLSEAVVNHKGETTVFNANPFSASWQEIASGLAWGLGYFGMPHIIVRFMSTKNAKVLKKSATIGIVWVVLSLGAAIAFAILGRAFDPTRALVETGKTDLIFITLVGEIFNGPWVFIAGLLLSAIVAAAMSTADSQLLVASSSFTSDIYKPVFRKKASDKETLWIGRIVVLIIAVIAFFIAKSGMENEDSSANAIMTMVDNAWGGFGSAFGPVIILSLFWKRFTYKGAIAGVVAGALVDVSWMIFLTDKTGVYELLPGFIAGLVFAVVVSLLDKKPSKEVEALYDKAISAEIE
ncbi:MAG: sodium/proline symporter PutP [Acutalibacteraceae bacterium]|nr:sodium/proline symporter PutP [Acutalibacteraceae bacterium]